MGAPGTRRGRRRAAGVVLGLALLAAGCSSDGSDGATTSPDPGAGASTTAADAPTTTIEPAEVERFTDGDFYEVPDPLPAGSPGQLIRVQDLGTADEYATVKVMYHSIDSQGDDRAATGLITYPTAEAPAG